MTNVLYRFLFIVLLFLSNLLDFGLSAGEKQWKVLEKLQSVIRYIKGGRCKVPDDELLLLKPTSQSRVYKGNQILPKYIAKKLLNTKQSFIRYIQRKRNLSDDQLPKMEFVLSHKDEMIVASPLTHPRTLVVSAWLLKRTLKSNENISDENADKIGFVEINLRMTFRILDYESLEKSLYPREKSEKLRFDKLRKGKVDVDRISDYMVAVDGKGECNLMFMAKEDKRKYFETYFSLLMEDAKKIKGLVEQSKEKIKKHQIDDRIEDVKESTEDVEESIEDMKESVGDVNVRKKKIYPILYASGTKLNLMIFDAEMNFVQNDEINNIESSIQHYRPFSLYNLFKWKKRISKVYVKSLD